MFHFHPTVLCSGCTCPLLDYLVHDTEDNGVYKADSSHSHQTQQEEVGITIQLKVGGFGIKDGAHQLAFGCAETWAKKRGWSRFLNLCSYFPSLPDTCFSRSHKMLDD